MATKRYGGPAADAAAPLAFLRRGRASGRCARAFERMSEGQDTPSRGAAHSGEPLVEEKREGARRRGGAGESDSRRGRHAIPRVGHRGMIGRLRCRVKSADDERRRTIRAARELRNRKKKNED